MKNFFGLVAGLAFGTLAFGQGDEIDCKNANSTVEMNYCAGRIFQSADAELNAVYGKVLSLAKAADAKAPNFGTGKPDFVNKLVASEKTWIKLRDQNCEFESASWFGGTGYGYTYTNCLTKETKSRTAYLRALEKSFRR